MLNALSSGDRCMVPSIVLTTFCLCLKGPDVDLELNSR